MNKARLEWHRERQRETAAYFRKKNAALMAEWRDFWANVDRQDPAVLEAHGKARGEMGMRLVAAAEKLDGERAEGARKRAHRLLVEEYTMYARAARLRAGEKPLDEWATCRCGSAFQPGSRGYTTCWTCSSTEYYKSSYACVYCGRRHSMSFPVCFACGSGGGNRGDDGLFLRLLINRRDNYTCAMCGIDAMVTGTLLQVDHIRPLDHGGTPDPWNLQSLCVVCQTLKGKSYDKHDEREFWRMVHVYMTRLFEYLAPDEQARLLDLRPDTEREQIDFAKRPDWLKYDASVAERDGILNVLAAFDTRPTVTESHDHAANNNLLLPDPCKGEVVLSTGARSCRNTTDFREGILCGGPCR